MTKAYFIELANYTVWANSITLSWLENISEEQWKMTIVSSFNSIEETVLHLAGAEKLWVDRLNKVTEPVPLAKIFNGDKSELLEVWRVATNNLKGFVAAFDENELKTPLRFKRLNGVEYVQPYYQLLAHIFNHSTYHRGQLVTMLRQAGYKEISSTDMLGFFR